MIVAIKRRGEITGVRLSAAIRGEGGLTGGLHQSAGEGEREGERALVLVLGCGRVGPRVGRGEEREGVSRVGCFR